MLSARLRQHIVEFIAGTGIITDGVANNSSLNGPWSWVVPEGFLGPPVIDAAAGGGGGAGGGNTANAISEGGGGGGFSVSVLGYSLLSVSPGEIINVTLGAATVGSSAANNGVPGGATSVLASSAGQGIYSRGLTVDPTNNSGVAIGGGSSTSTFANGGAGGGQNIGGGGSGGGNGGNSSGSLFDLGKMGMWICNGGGGGGSGSNVASTNGGNGGDNYNGTTGPNTSWASWRFLGLFTSHSLGSNTGSISQGGGGAGGSSPWGIGGKGGDGGNTGSSAASTAYGAGGGGGGGGAAGGNGANGYVRITYWSWE